ncbi:BARH1 protein, partial [Piaya cayana]|nr:BARH1 protein [Piaya cayana]
MEGSTGFGIDSILSHRAGSPAGPKGDPLELSPRSEGSSGCPSPRSPGRECLEAAGPRPSLEAHHLPPVSAPSQSRTVTSSFLIRDILADCKPLAACAPYSSTNGPHGGQEAAGRVPTKPGEDFREKMEKNTSGSSSDSEYKGSVGDNGREISPFPLYRWGGLSPFPGLLPSHPLLRRLGKGMRKERGRGGSAQGGREPGSNFWSTPDPLSRFVSPPPRTKWKRQTAVGLELLAEAGNYSALQRMFPSPYFYPQSLVSNLDPGAALYLYRGPSAPPPALQRPLVPRILIHGLQGGSDPPP